MELNTAGPWTQQGPDKWVRTHPRGIIKEAVGWVEERPYASGQWAAHAAGPNGTDVVQVVGHLVSFEEAKAAVDAWLVANGWALEGA